MGAGTWSWLWASPTRERDNARATLGSELGLGPGEKEEGARVEGDRPGLKE